MIGDEKDRLETMGKQMADQTLHAHRLQLENEYMRKTLARIADERLTIGRSLHSTLNGIIKDAKRCLETLEERS